jgi:RNA polymerase sigma factor (sigma-70 family)
MTDPAMIEANIPLVLYFARPFRERADYEDICAHGRLGLVLAATRYDGRVKFPSFAGDYIRGYIYRWLNRHADTVRTPQATLAAQGRIHCHSLDLPIGEGGEDTLVDLLPDPHTVETSDVLDRRAMPDAIRREIACMHGLTRTQRKRLLGYLAGDCPFERITWILAAARRKLAARKKLEEYWRQI